MIRETMRGSASSNKARNKATIERAFSNMRSNEQSVALQGMIAAAKAGLEYLVEAHEIYEHDVNGWESHIHEQNTMAYAVAHDGRIYAAESYDGNGDDMPGEAMRMATDILSTTTGWVAIILSEMGDWYMLEKEQDYQRYSRQQIIAHFNDYFKPFYTKKG
mgnify:CR=1 FL=1